MEKRLIPLAITLFLISQAAASQNPGVSVEQFEAIYKATYIASFQPDSNDVESKQTGIIFTLYISAKHSYFVNNERYMRDSIVYEVGKGNISPNFVLANLNSMPQPRANFRVFKNRVENEIITINPIYNKDYAYSEPISIISWQIHPKTQVIGELNCQMATGSFAGRDYIAWFTTEIRIPEGPYKFNGLPGLIVRIADTKDHYSFDLLDIRNIRELVQVLPPDPVEWTTKRRFNQERSRFNQNPISYYEAEGMVFDRETRMQIRDNLIERNKRNNNRIELKYE